MISKKKHKKAQKSTKKQMWQRKLPLAKIRDFANVKVNKRSFVQRNKRKEKIIQTSKSEIHHPKYSIM